MRWPVFAETVTYKLHIFIKLGCYNYIIGRRLSSSASVTPIGIAVFGGVGGVVLLALLITLCNIVCCVVCHCKRRKSTNGSHFAPAHSVSPRNLYELKDMENIERNSGMEAKICHRYTSRLTIVSHEDKKKQAIHDKRVCYLHIAPL